MLSSAEIIARYYVGYYNRAPDPLGFAFWINAYNEGVATLDIANFFADQAETRALYPYFSDPATSTPEAFITSIYQNLFNRDPDGAGAAFWLDALTTGAVNTGQMIEAIIGGATTNPDLAVVRNKVSAGIYWEDQANNFTNFEYSQTAAESATTILDIVTDKTASLTESRAQTNKFFATLTEDKGTPDDGLTNDGNEEDKIGLSDQGPLSEQIASEDEIGLSTSQSADVLNLTAFRNDGRFSGIDGQGGTVVVIDTGIDLNHQAFGPDADDNGVADRIIYARDFTSEGDGTANDVQSHGSHVASIIGSSEVGYLGVAPGVNIVALQALDNGGSGTSRSIEDSLRWVIDNAEALNIVAVNMSLGTDENVNIQTVHPVYGDELRFLDNQLGVTTVVAAGNSYELYEFEGATPLAADPYTLAIGAVGGQVISSGDIAAFSQRSADIPTIFAPGVGINAAIPGGGAAHKTGTSMAAPHVAGMVALAQQLAQQELGRFLSSGEMRQLLTLTGTRFVDDANPDDRVFNTGAEYGRVDMFEMGLAILELAGSGGSLPPSDPETLPRNGDTIPDSIATDARIAVDGFLQSTVNYGGDLDYFAVSLEAGTYEISLNGAATNSGTLSDPVLTLLSGSGAFLATNDDGGTGLNALIAFTVSTGGEYYISAGAYGSATGSYELAVVQTGGHDSEIGDTAATASLLTIGQPVTNALEFGADRDWFAIDLTAGQTYVFDMVGGTLADPFLFLYNADGSAVGANDDGGAGQDASLEFTANRSGTHYLSAEAYSNAMTGTYTLSVASLGSGSDDFADNISTTGVLIAEGGAATGRLEQSGDSDWFRVDVQGNTTYDFRLVGTGGTDTLGDPYLYLYDSTGGLIGSDDDGGEGLTSLISYSTSTNHTIYLAADAFGSSATGAYRLEATVTSRTQVDIAGDTTTTATLAPGQSILGALETPGDADWYVVNVNAGQTYDFSLSRSGLDPINDPYLILLDGSGNLIGIDDDGGEGLNAMLSFQAHANGRVFVSAEAFDLENDAGTYEISLASTPFGNVDTPSNTSTTVGIAPGQSLIGTLDGPGDTDWYFLDIVAGQSYQIDLTRGGSAPIVDPFLVIFDGAGAFVLSDDDGGNGLDAHLAITANTTGRIYLSAEAYDINNDLGTYELSVLQGVSTTSLQGVSHGSSGLYE
ncbi:S8 family serine peptidase [Sulfitobacter sp. F26204]|uniref:S8 family serine peptidase n=1 Tax=Sulfitobacter sp. F26204 TaxID=2996014 RepID=UPI00225E6DA9|nr:S8 family serine peptidase [Sulfitobacter sp. F26204]MCX7558416.1 S8 family serine peptidase [Sulfitobacter sp. F26204]